MPPGITLMALANPSNSSCSISTNSPRLRTGRLVSSRCIHPLRQKHRRGSMSTKAPFSTKTSSVIPYSTLQGDGSITHLGVTYSITHAAHQSDTPLETCVQCGGSGQLYTRKCKHCHGRGMVVRNTPQLRANRYAAAYTDESEDK